MFRVFVAQNSRGDNIVHVRIDRIGTGQYRSRWVRSTYGWEAMYSTFQTHRQQVKAVFGPNLEAILAYSLFTNLSGNWEPHLNRVELGDQTRVDLDDVNSIAVDILASLSYSEAQTYADLGRRLARKGLKLEGRNVFTGFTPDGREI
jgi:hypothetical protein